MLGVTASELQALPGQFSPWFDLCHYTLAALAVRKEVGVSRARANPLATWLATMSASFAGSLLANPLLGNILYISSYSFYIYTLRQTNPGCPEQ